MSSVTFLLILVTLVFAVVAGLAANALTQSRQTRRDTRSPQDLARAARLLDQVRASDEVMPQLPAALRTEIDRFLSDYFKELQQ